MARDMDLALNCVEKAKNDHSRGFGRCARKLLESFSWNDCGWGILPRVTTFFLWSLCVRWTMVVMVVNIAAFVLIKCQVPCHILHFFSAHRDFFVGSMVMMRVMFLSLVLVAAVRPDQQNLHDLHEEELKSVKKHHERASSTGCCSVYDESAKKYTGYCKTSGGCHSFEPEILIMVDEKFCAYSAGPCWFMQDGFHWDSQLLIYARGLLQCHEMSSGNLPFAEPCVRSVLNDRYIHNAILKLCYLSCSGPVSWRWPETWT